MLLLNKKQITADELIETLQLDIPLSKIIAAPVFKINPDKSKFDKLNNQKRVPAGLNPVSFFTARTKDGKTIEIRYAESVVDEYKDDKLVPVYEPRKVSFRGSADMYPDIDLALYMYLYPLCKTSPWPARNEPYYYYFEDKQAEATAEMAKITDLRRAFSYIEALKGDHLRIVAKGMDVQNVDRKSEIELKSELSILAQKGRAQDRSQANPAEFFNEKINRKDTLFDGIVTNSIDKHFFRLHKTGAGAYWLWAAGPLNGDRVVDVISTSKTAEQTLKEHIKTHISDFYSILIDLQTTAVRDAKVDDYLANQDPAADLFGKAGAISENPLAHANSFPSLGALPEEEEEPETDPTSYTGPSMKVEDSPGIDFTAMPGDIVDSVEQANAANEIIQSGMQSMETPPPTPPKPTVPAFLQDLGKATTKKAVTKKATAK